MKSCVITLVWICLALLPAPRGRGSYYYAAAAGGGGGGYTPNTVHFAGDGQCWMERDAQLFPAEDDQVYASFWIKPAAAGAGSLDCILILSNDGVRIFLTSGDKLRFDCEDAASTPLVVMDSTASITRDGSTWTHIFIRVDRTVDNQGEIYVNGSASTTITTFLSTGEDADSMDLDAPEAFFGALDSSGILPFDGCMADVWISVGNTYSGLTVGDFISGGDPVDLGTTGTNPDSTQPNVFFKGSGTAFNVNSGSGGNFVKKGTTALTTCSTTP